MEIKSAAGFPLEFRGEQLGSIGFLAHRRITTEEFALLGIFADQAALAIRNAQLYQEIERYRDRLEQENAYLQEAIAEERGFEGIVGESPRTPGRPAEGAAGSPGRNHRAPHRRDRHG